jgi:predicted NAD/FAD-binding protein
MSSSSGSRPPRVAVVGGGIAGLSCSWLLSQTPGQYTVVLFERHSSPGLDAHVAHFTDEDGRQRRVDIPFRVFNKAYYANMAQLLDRIEVRWEDVDYSGSYSRWAQGAAGGTFFSYKNLLLGGLSLPVGFFGSVRVALEALWFFAAAPRDLNAGRLAGVSFGEYLDAKGYSGEFKRSVLLVALAVMCTCTIESMASYPAEVVVFCLCVRSGSGIQRAIGGNQILAERLGAVCEVRCNSRVSGVYRGASGSLVVQHEDGTEEPFDKVIFATQANHALRLLKDATPEEREALGLFEYQHSSVVVHSDPSLMPAREADWGCVNFFDHDEKAGGPTGKAGVLGMPMATIWLNKVSSEMRGVVRNVFQTWNPLSDPDPSTVLCVSSFDRPVMSPSTVKGISLLNPLQGARGIYFCGSYARVAMPLLENGVHSAMEIAHMLGSPAPWARQDRKVKVLFSNQALLSAAAYLSAAAILLARLARDL